MAAPLEVALDNRVPLLPSLADGMPTTATVGGSSEVLLGGEGDSLIIGAEGGAVLLDGIGSTATAGSGERTEQANGRRKPAGDKDNTGERPA